MSYILYADGASRGNPGNSAIGAIIYSPTGAVISKISQRIGIGTNNEAEYQALIAGLQEAKKQNINEIQIFLDSELIVKQIIGKYKVKSQKLSIMHTKVVSLLKQFNKWNIKHVPREQNSKADSLANLALDQN